MFKPHCAPTVNPVTHFTIIFRIILGINVPIMDILMAIGAPQSYVTESPPLCLFMAHKTGGGHVCPLQLKTAFGIMTVESIHGTGESFGTVTGGATGGSTIPAELILMVIGVAIRTPGMVQRCRQAEFMAGSTLDGTVPVHQWKVSPVMIKTCGRNRRPERHFRMAIPAILAELSLVHILVARSAIVKCYPCKALKLDFPCDFNLMAFLAISPGMLADKRKFRASVVKFDCSLE